MRIIILLILMLVGNGSFAQNGLEAIIVEKYYISDEADAKITEGGYLKTGSVTYRIYVDMKPKYSLQAVYGISGHPLKIATTTYFFNNTVNGGAVSNDVSRLKLDQHTTMLDSWVSVGAGSDTDYGIMKADDSYNSFTNKNGILKNNNPDAGIPLTKYDGLMAATPQRVVSFFGIDKSNLEIFNNTTDTSARGQSFMTDNGSWASFGGAYGPDTTNKVLIAQLTTDGQLSFELNLQLGTPFGGTENYYAQNPQGSELQVPDLTYPAVKNNVPEVKWVSVFKNKTIKRYKQQTLLFSASDKDNNIRKVDLYVNDTKLTELFVAPFEFSWNPQMEGPAKIHAVVHDFAGAKSKSEEITFIVQ
jgi:hypothetical protein